MKITIDNHDGNGAVNYSCYLAAAPLKIARTLNAPSECTFTLDCNTGAKVPAQFGRVIVTSDAGIALFTGYIIQPPAGIFTGATMAGSVYGQQVNAISDEWLLNLQSVPVTAGSVAVPVTSAMQVLTERVDPVRFTVSSTAASSLGQYRAEPAAAWSENASELAAMARASYRVLNGQLALQPIGSVTHALSESAGSLDVSKLAVSQTKILANDVTVCGGFEPQAYVTDIFQGDGTTAAFELTRKPFLVSAVAGALVVDSFAGPGINPVVWQANDPGTRLSITGAGLNVNGGNGLDGQTTVSGVDNIEMGGSLVLTASGVQAQAGSDGYLACFYNGSILLTNLFAGFHVTQSSGSTSVTPVVNGVASGTLAPLIAGHMYTLRLRYHACEMQRVLSSYYVAGSSGDQQLGGGLIGSAAHLVFELQDTTAGVGQAPLVLYDGSVAQAPANCILAAVNSPAFTGSIGSITLQQMGSPWVTSLPVSGSAFTRRIGAATTGADCHITTTGKIEFYATSVPAAGETITVTYRTAGVAVARMINPAAVAAQAAAAGAGVLPGVSRWVGSVTAPKARSSADCENAGLALLAIAASPGAAMSGKYLAPNLQRGSNGDVWPGDLLAAQASSSGLNANLVVRTVTITADPVQPELLEYSVAFANEWAEELSVKTSATVPKDAWLPQNAIAAPMALANLAALTVTVTSSQIQVSAGVSAPAGGGFEVRRVDWRFGPGTDGTLVLRSPVPDFTILREAAIEQYYVRMYDGSTPPNYSRFSAEVCISVPLASA